MQGACEKKNPSFASHQEKNVATFLFVEKSWSTFLFRVSSSRFSRHSPREGAMLRLAQGTHRHHILPQRERYHRSRKAVLCSSSTCTYPLPACPHPDPKTVSLDTMSLIRGKSSPMHARARPLFRTRTDMRAQPLARPRTAQPLKRDLSHPTRTRTCTRT